MGKYDFRGNNKPVGSEVLFSHGLGCWYHDNCFTCPLTNGKCIYNSDKSQSAYTVVDQSTYRKLVIDTEEFGVLHHQNLGA